MDTKLLMELFHIPSRSGQESDVQHFIVNYLEEIDIPFEVDSKGNIYNISHNDKPMLSAHMDTVQDYDDTLFAKFIEIKDGIINGYGVIGGDDKCGIYAILDLLTNGHRDINFCFTVEEEIGGIGSEYFEANNDLTHMSYCLVLDRMGSDDILCSGYHDYGTQEFEDVLVEMGKDYGYGVGHGTFCDADYFSNQLSCANISCGYYNAHSKHEFVVLADLQNCINYVHSVIKNIDMKFEAPYSCVSHSTSYKGKITNYNDDYEWMDEYDWMDEFDDIQNKLDGDKVTYPNGKDKRKSQAATMSNADESYCELCSKYKTSRLIKTIGVTACPDCVDDLLWELSVDAASEDLEVM
jgi:tripeptide aminopeptidase